MKTLALIVLGTITLFAVFASCGGSSQDAACNELEAKCPYCTLPGLRTTCEGAVDTNDHDSCVDGLEDPNVISNCVAPSDPDASANNIDASANNIDATNNVGAVCGAPNQCICPTSVTCSYQCISGIDCDMQCGLNSSCTTECTGSDPCDVECVTTSGCNVDCNDGNCDVACPSNNCTVTNCPAGPCQVTCGPTLLPPTRTGTTATCP